jgi:Tol biopolymer transport system component
MIDLATSDTASFPVGGSYAWLVEGSWSPDGSTFAVTTASADSAAWAIRTVDSRGTTEIVAEDSVLLASPRWSPDGRTLYYSRGTDAIMGVSISGRTGKRSGPARIVLNQLEIFPSQRARPHFALSLSGGRITYARGYHFSNLFMIEPATGMPRPLETRLTSGTALRWGPTVSPDGEWIAFVEQAGGSAELFRMPVGGGAPSQITFGARVLRQSQVGWSPDGSQLAFISERGGPVRVWIADVEGGRVRALERTRASLNRGHLTWAGGARIAYLNGRHRNIILVDPVTGDQRGLVTDTTIGWLFSPRYSPDGARLVANWNRIVPEKEFGVWSFDPKTGSSAKLDGPGIWPAGWSADGRYVYTHQTEVFPRTISRLHAEGAGPPRTAMALPWRESQCTPVGARRPGAFVCAVFEAVSDVWMIEDFE